MTARLSVMLFITVLCGCSNSGPSHESRYPDRPIKLIVPFGAGGGTDAFARVIDKSIKDNDLLPQPLVIVNMDGAGATIGSRRVKNARPDGYTVLILHDAIITAKLSDTVEYGPEAFTPVAGTGQMGMVIAVHEDSPYKTLADLLKAGKEKPGGLSFGANVGALTHYAGLFLERESPGVAFNYIQLGGGAERFTHIAGGHIDVTGFSIEEFTRYRPKGLRGLAVFDAEPNPAIPDVPTAKSQGINIVLSNTFYWWVPKGTPPERVEVLVTALRKSWQSPAVQKRLAEMHCRPVFLTGDDLQKQIDTSEALFGSVSAKPTAELPNYPRLALAAIVAVIALRLLQLWQRKRMGTELAIPEERVPEARVPGAHHEPDAPALGTRIMPRTGTAVTITLLTFAYAGVLTSGRLSFGWTTSTFVIACGLILLPHTRRNLALLTALAIVMGFGLQALLTGVFDVHFS